MLLLFQSTYTTSTVVIPVITQHGSARRNRRNWKDYQELVEDEAERHEMKLSEELARKLQEQIAFNQAMMQVNNNILLANSNLLSVVNEIQIKSEVVPNKSAMDPKKKEELLLRLEKARETKNENKRLAEEKRKQQLKNLAKARKARGK
jgi:hypothetical protein